MLAIRRPLSSLARCALAAAIGAATFVACAGSGIQIPAPANAPASTQAIPTAGGTLAVPAAANAQAASIGIASGAPSGVTLTSSSSTKPPAGAPAPSSVERAPEALSGAVPFFYVIFSVSAPLPARYLSSQSVTLTTSDPVSAAYYVEYDDITSTPYVKLFSAGPATVANGVATISNIGTDAPTSSTTFEPLRLYMMQFYYLPSGTATPTPNPVPGNATISTVSRSASAEEQR